MKQTEHMPKFVDKDRPDRTSVLNTVPRIVNGVDLNVGFAMERKALIPARFSWVAMCDGGALPRIAISVVNGSIGTPGSRPEANDIHSVSSDEKARVAREENDLGKLDIGAGSRPSSPSAARCGYELLCAQPGARTRRSNEKCQGSSPLAGFTSRSCFPSPHNEPRRLEEDPEIEARGSVDGASVRGLVEPGARSPRKVFDGAGELRRVTKRR